MAERVTRQQVEIVAAGDGDVRVTQQYVEILSSSATTFDETASSSLVGVITVTATYDKVSSVSASSTLGLTQEAVKGLVLADASSTLSLGQSADWAGPLPQADANNTLAMGVVTSKTFGALARAATSTIVASQETNQSLKYLYAETLTEEMNLSVSTRLAETYELAASNIIVASQIANGWSLSPKAESTISLAQFADTSEIQRNPVSTLVLTQTAVGENIKTAQSTIALTQTANRGAIERYAVSALSLSHQARYSPINRALTSELVLAQSVRQSIRNVFATTAIDLLQTVHVVRPFYASAESPITGIELVYDPITAGPIYVTNAITSTASVVVDPTRDATSIISLSQTATPVLLKSTATAKSATSTLALTQEAITGFDEDASSTISLSQSANGVIGYTASSELSQPTPEDVSEITYGLRDEAIHILSKATPAASTLLLKQTLLYELIVDTTECDYTPFVGSTEETDLPEPPRTTLPAPYAGRTTDRLRLVYPDFSVTSNPSIEITLRAPSLGNREGVQSLRINRETRGGSLIIFADPKWPQFVKLSMQFRALSQAQAWDLLAFLDDTLGHFVGLQDHEGRAWKGIITNPDEAVVQDGPGCKYSASIEMEAEFVNLPGVEAETDVTLLDASSEDFGAYGRVASSSLGLTDATESDGVHNEAASTPLALIGSAVSSGVSGRFAEDALGLSDAADREATLGKSPSSSLGLTDQADAVHTVFLAATSATGITDSAVRTYITEPTAADVLALTDAPGKSRIRDMANRPSDATLAMSHETSFDMVWSRAGSNSISMSDEALGAIELPEFSGSLKHRWDASELSLSDGQKITTVTDTGVGLVNLQAPGGVDTYAPTYKTNILNGQPVMRFVQGSLGQVLQSVSNTTLFPSKRGTIAIVTVPRESLAGTSSRFYLYENRNETNIEQFHFGGESNVDRPYVWVATGSDSADGIETPPPNYAPEGEGQILIVNRDSDTTLLFRRNGVAETGRALTGNPVPVVGTFKLGGNGQVAQSIDVDIAVCLVYNKSLSTAEMIELESYLMVVYGIR